MNGAGRGQGAAPEPAVGAADRAVWVGVAPWSDRDCGDRLCLYRRGDELLAWCRDCQQLIGACGGCGTALGVGRLATGQLDATAKDLGEWEEGR